MADKTNLTDAQSKAAQGDADAAASASRTPQEAFDTDSGVAENEASGAAAHRPGAQTGKPSKTTAKR